MSSQTIDTAFIGIGEIIKNHQLAVPSYQRSYAWEEDNVVELLDDTRGAIARGEKEYFLGSAVLTRRGDSLEIIDGQQRIATTSIIIAAIRNWLLSSGDSDNKERANIIDNEFLSKQDIKTLRKKPRLQLNLSDDPFYISCIIESDASTMPSHESHQRIASALRLIAERVDEVAKNAGYDSATKLLEWIEYLRDSAKIIRVIVPDNANAFTIFETLNDRGRDLTISDLIKNFIFSEAKNKLESTKASWISMATNLENLNEKNIQVDFLRQAWSSRNGLTRERELFREFKKSISSPSDAVDVTKKLESSSSVYADIVSCSYTTWSKLGTHFIKSLQAINMMGVEIVRPLLLAVVENFKSDNEKKKAVELIKNCVIRSKIVGGQRGTYEKYYCSIASQIYNGKISKVKDLSIAIKKIAPTDEAFSEAFALASFSQPKISRYILRTIERTVNPSASEWDPAEDEGRVNLEHILPKVKGHKWDGFDEETHRTYRNRLGNHCLLSAGINSKLGNDSFQDKKVAFSTSTFETTKWAGGYRSWNPESIKERQDKLADYAAKSWPLST